MEKVLLFIGTVMLWGFLLLLFHSLKMNFYKFLVGSVGIFTITMIFFMSYLENNLNLLISNGLSIIGEYTGYFQVFKSNAIISIDTANGIVSMIINYECSGIIEILVFTSLVLFFPFGDVIRKSISFIGGNIYIFIANMIRLNFIIFITKTFGASAFYLVHTLYARILFFILILILYYFVFTSTHLKYQKIGDVQ